MSAPLPASPPGPPPERFPEPWASDWGEDSFGLWQALTYKGARQALRWIPPTLEPFWMGSPADEHGHDRDELRHQVTLTRGYWIADTACTQALWEAVTGARPSRFEGSDRPVENISWEDIQGFLDRLGAQLDAVVARRPTRAIGRSPDDALSAAQGPMRLRLPTEAEWEYACRAGTTGPFAFGDDIDPELANYDGNHPYRGSRKGLYRGETVPVASLPANAWGLYEMHGNVWEWCHDWFGDYPSVPVTDPVGPLRGEDRVLRGGSWFDVARLLRSAARYANLPGYRSRYHSDGFRFALGPELQPASNSQ